MKQAETGTALALVLAASWAWVAWTTLDMSNPVVELMMPVDASWTWVTVLAVFAMWAGMMVAMMLASAAPMIRTFSAAEQRKTPGTQWATRTALFASAYLFIWTLFSVAATGLQWGAAVHGFVVTDDRQSFRRIDCQPAHSRWSVSVDAFKACLPEPVPHADRVPDG